MSHFDELPRRDRNLEIEDEAIAAFQARLTESGAFILQSTDRKDFGTDCQIEVIAEGQATNARVHVQLKGTGRTLNADGSLSIEVRRTNLNYLLMQPYSVYVAYHVPTDSLRICAAERVARQYQHSGRNWTDQESITISFIEELTVERVSQLAELARSGAKSARDRRVAQGGLATADLSNYALESPPDVHVPDEPALARKLLMQLYEKQADEAISAGFAKFAAALGAASDEMGICYMSEINLGMDGLSRYPDRIHEAITFFRRRLSDDRCHLGGLYYTIGNAFLALGNEPEAKRAFESALADPSLEASPELAADVHKNLGSSYSLLGKQKLAVAHYRKALELNPELAEAHNALGNYYIRQGEYEDALRHFDQAVFSDQKQGRISAVSGWRANVLFNLGDGRAAFREINALLPQADRLRWIWPWCRRLVGGFGRATAENAVQALPFWQRYLRSNPEDPAARWEILMTTFYLRGQGLDVRKGYSEFREEFDQHIAYVDADDAALPWDRLGHWAQDEGRWAEAERCFRKAYELAGGEYGYCLAIALKALERFDESVPLLLEQAQIVQPDAKSWFQLAGSYASQRSWLEAVNAYEKALAQDPDYAVAMFDLGGAHWNSGNAVVAVEVWTAAFERFPNHELVRTLRRDLPSLFSDLATGLSSDGTR